MKILGLDPGSINTGYAIIHKENNKLVHLEHGNLKPPKDMPFDDRLKFISEGLETLIKKFLPKICVIEQPFLGLNTKSLISLAQMQGALIYVLKSHNVSIIRKSPREIKKSVTGSGSSTKEQVRLLALKNLNIASSKNLDATDALAVALSVT